MGARVTDELWHVAETGDIDELRRVVCRGVDVNARNKHGMTALMRAAYHGHERLVRALLDHGANPNLARNDSFTALALAAFFGHTETVKTLIEHGARPDVVTRCGTSAYMWARARTFEEAARCLKSSTPRKDSRERAESSAPGPARPQVAALKTGSAVVKTLKDPPEIWDLVHETPKSFNARSVFVSRLKSMRASFALRVAAVLLVSLTGVVGVLVLRGSEARNLVEAGTENQEATAGSAGVPAKTETSGVFETSASAVDANDLPADSGNNHHAPVASDETTSVNGSRKMYTLTRQSRGRFTQVEAPLENPQPVEPPAAPTLTVATPQFESRSSAESSSKPKTNTGLSPQLIAPTKGSPPKGKVIQWP